MDSKKQLFALFHNQLLEWIIWTDLFELIFRIQLLTF
jgi:hypothetical protein